MHTPTPRPASPLDRAVKDAAMKLLGLQMTRIVGEADKADADALHDDLQALARILDPIFVAFGDYAAESFCNIDKSDFADVVFTAIDGFAAYQITQAGEALQEDFDESPAGRREFQRERV